MLNTKSVTPDLKRARWNFIEFRIQILFQELGGILTDQTKDLLLEMNLGELELLASRMAMSPTVAGASFLMTIAIVDSERRRRIVEFDEASHD